LRKDKISLISIGVKFPVACYDIIDPNLLLEYPAAYGGDGLFEAASQINEKL
jgi:hypothetical protein